MEHSYATKFVSYLKFEFSWYVAWQLAALMCDLRRQVIKWLVTSSFFSPRISLPGGRPAAALRRPRATLWRDSDGQTLGLQQRASKECGLLPTTTLRPRRAITARSALTTRACA